MKVVKKLQNGQTKTYSYDRRKYYKPKEKMPPKHQRLPESVQNEILRLHELHLGASKIAKFLNSDGKRAKRIGRTCVYQFLKNYFSLPPV